MIRPLDLVGVVEGKLSTHSAVLNHLAFVHVLCTDLWAYDKVAEVLDLLFQANDKRVLEGDFSADSFSDDEH